MPFLLLMPSYNQDRFIGEAIRSCLIQDDPDWELWILDNSTDRTPEIVASFSDPRIHFEHRPGEPVLALASMSLLRFRRVIVSATSTPTII